MPTYQDHDMRANPFDLREMIAREDDPKLRVMLMLVNASNENQAANTLAVEGTVKALNDLSSKLDKHMISFEERAAKDDELRNQGKGAWRVLAWVLGGVQVIGLGIWVDAKTDIKEIHQAITAGQTADLRIEARQLAFEQAITNLQKAAK